jgi:hypothetical protein
MDTFQLSSAIFIAVFAVMFFIGGMIWSSLWWLFVVSGLFFIMLGYNSVTSPEEVFYGQRMLSVVWFVIGAFGVLFMPMYFKKKNDKSAAEMLSEADGEKFSNWMEDGGEHPVNSKSKQRLYDAYLVEQAYWDNVSANRRNTSQKKMVKKIRDRL